MKPAPLPADEPERLRLLHELRVLDAEVDPALEAVVRLAAHHCGWPAAAVSLIDAERQWIAASIGLDLRETPRAVAFCAHAILQGDSFEVPDATLDPRFADNPFVLAPNGVRAYASHPVTVDGHRIGTIHAIDHRPNRLAPAALAALRDLATLAGALLDARLHEQRTRLQEARVRGASRAGSDWLWETDAEGVLTWVSDSVESHTGEPPGTEVGRAARSVNQPRDDDHRVSYEAYLAARAEHRPFKDAIADRDTQRGRISVAMSGHPVFDSAGVFKGYRGAARNVTEELVQRDEARRAETALAEQRARLAAVLRALPDLWFVIDRDGCYLECSDVRHPWLLRPFSELRGRSFATVLNPDDAAQALAAVRTALASGEVQRIEYELTVGDGTHHHLEARISPMDSERVLYLVRDLTELRTLERDMQLMRRAFEAEASLPMVVADATVPGLPLIWVNSGFERLSGRPRSELLGHSSRFLLDSEAEQPEMATLRAALAAGRGCTVTLRNVRADGTRFLNEVHVAPVRDEAGKLTHWICVQSDVTERNRSAAQLAMSEALHRSVAATISDGLLVVDRAGAIVTANASACALLASSSAQLLGKRLSQLGYVLQHADGRPVAPHEHPVRRVLSGSAALLDQDHRLRRPDGAERLVRVSVQALPHEEAGGASCVVTFRDITAEHAAAVALAQSEERWKFALEGGGEGVYDYDEVRRIAFFSPRWKAILGYDDHEIGTALQEWTRRIHPEDHPRVREAMRRYREGETPSYETEHRLRHKSGHWIWVLDRGKAVARGPDGQVLRVVGTHMDITRQKADEKALREQQAIEMASRAKSEFLSRMSHEMRTPLNAVIGFAQLLKMRGAGDAATLRQYSEHILSSGQHLLALVNDVLDLQQVEEGRLTLAPADLALDAALDGALVLLQPLIAERGILVQREGTTGLQVHADAQRLRQVLLNLLSNAVKYNRDHGSLRISVSVAQAQAVVGIEDSGSGMSAEQLARLFQPFERLGRESSGIEGTGLGLIIARRLMQEMGGGLDIASAVGTGTRVTLAVPLARPTGAAPLRMLYVEDNKINAMLFEEAIKLRGGIELRVAEDVAEALAMARAWPPAVLVLDAHLPSGSGLTLLPELRRLPGLGEVPAWLCSADNGPDDERQARLAGFAGYWAKPIDIQRVLADLDTLRTTMA